MGSHFFALFSRMKYINRWALMKNTEEEPLSQHCFEVAAFAHALAVIGNKRLGKHYNAAEIAVTGMYHDMPEILTGDMPTPVKYYNSEIRGAFGKIEKTAQESLVNTLPDDMREEYKKYICPDESSEEYKIVKAADKLSALIKCIEELKSGNNEFLKAEEATRKSLEAMKCEEAEIFMNEYLDSYSLVLDTVLKEEEN